MRELALAVAEHPRWLPLALDCGGDDAPCREVDLLVGGIAAPERIAVLTEQLAEVHRQVDEAAQQADAMGITTLAAWMLLPAPSYLEVGPVATLQTMPLDPSRSVDDLVESLTAPQERREGQVEVGELPTSSGLAVTVGQRPLSEAGGERRVQEEHSVLWLRPQDEVLLVLACSVTADPPEAGMRDALHELAAGLVIREGA